MMTTKNILLKACIAGSFLVVSRPAVAFAFVEFPYGCIIRAKVHTDIRRMRFIFVAARNDEDLLWDAEDAAAFDAHDLSDPGMEAAAMERSVIMAEEFKIKQSNKKNQETTEQTKAEMREKSFDDMQTSEDDTLSDAEDAAAFDAHDLSDPGMEAAAMERAVMMAEEFKVNQSNKKRQHSQKQIKLETKKDISREMHADENASLLDAEDAAAFDAHDLSDPGMEAAAMERAVMMANEFKNKKTEKSE